MAVRETSKRIVGILGDDSKIDEERKRAQELRDRLGGNLTGLSSSGKEGKYGGSSSQSYSSSLENIFAISNLISIGRYESYGSGSDNSKKPAWSSSGYNNNSSNYKDYGEKNKYDDDRKAGKWRVEKTEEPSSKKEPERDNGVFIFNIKSILMYTREILL